ncbi:MAG: asparagine synthase-related protein [Salinigranum sp.]
MNKELFGIFGDPAEFVRLRPRTEFDRIVEGERLTVGVRDVGLDVPDRTATYQDERGTCVIWGEAYPPTLAANAAEWLLDRYLDAGSDAFAELNGSYLVAVETADDAFVLTDPIRSWECYYTDDPGVRAFGTDPAAVARTIETPTLQRQQLLEFAHLGIVLGAETVFEELDRVPFDGRITASAADELRRFVYRPREFDYAGELAERLDEAVRRRLSLPGTKGLLLSAGFDSRTILARNSKLDACYTVGSPGSREATVAGRLAEQYGVPHRTLAPGESHLETDWESIQYGHGIKESIHIHHANYVDQIDVDTVYHGLLFDTFLRGHFLPRDDYRAFGHRLPRNGLASNPDPVSTLLTEKFGYIPACDAYGVSCPDGADSRQFARRALERELSRGDDRVDSDYNATALLGIRNQPTTTFRTHLVDHYLESFVAADSGLLQWHLTAPPEQRNSRTFLDAVGRLEGDVLRYRPPDRPHDSEKLNAVEQFVRARVPFLKPFEKSWPDRRAYYEQQNLDRKLFSAHPEIHDLPVRLKLRLNDLSCWINRVVDSGVVGPSTILSPPAERFTLTERRLPSQ